MYNYIFLALIIILFILISKKKEHFKTEKKKYDIIISINCYDNEKKLISQLNNINKFVKLKHLIILNPTPDFNIKIKNIIKNYNNVIINKNIFEKKRHTGLLLKGIYTNLTYIYKRYDFKYFIIMSSRNIFYNRINTVDQILKCKIKEKNLNWYSNLHKKKFEKTKLVNNNKSLIITSSPHEGLCLDYNNCISLIKYLEKNKIIKNDLFNANSCVEEFAIQSILLTINKYFYHIGIMSTSTVNTRNIDRLPKNKFVLKDKNDLTLFKNVLY